MSPQVLYVTLTRPVNPASWALKGHFWPNVPNLQPRFAGT